MSPRAPSVFGREVVLQGRPGSPRALRWELLRDSAIPLRQIGTLFASLCALSLAVGGFCFWQGAPQVMAFTALELPALGVALWLLARHAGDRETLTLVGRSLLVEQCIGRRVERADFAADWVTVEPAVAQGSLVELCSRGRRMRVGRPLRPEFRAAFAQELRRALRRFPNGALPENDSN